MRKIMTIKNIKTIVIFLTLVLFLYTFNSTSSRYMGQIMSTKEDVVAIPILNLNNNTTTYTITGMIPGQVSEYDFIVSNKEAEQINEILLEYYFTVTIGTEIPLKAKIYDITNDTQVELPMVNNQTSNERLEYGVEKSKKYRLQIIWDEKDNDLNYANQQTTLKLELKAVQVIN